jgi:beta-lactam-binding protein with PASTA domain
MNKYDVTVYFLGKTTTVRGVTGNTQEEAMEKVKTLVKFREVKKQQPPLFDIFNKIFGE